MHALHDASNCAAAVLDGLPPVMWFIRCQMRKRRTRGLTVPQFRALVLLDRYPTCSLSLIAEHLGVSQPSASRLISGLVSRGLVTRRECPDDRRQLALVLTAKGKPVLQEAQQATRESLARELAELTPAQRAMVASAMEILSSTFDCQPATRPRKELVSSGR